MIHARLKDSYGKKTILPRSMSCSQWFKFVRSEVCLSFLTLTFFVSRKLIFLNTILREHTFILVLGDKNEEGYLFSSMRYYVKKPQQQF